MTYAIAALVIVVAIQAAAIAGLLVARSRRAGAEQSLRDSEQQFRLMAEHAPVMIWTARPDTTLDYLNDTCLTFTGVPAASLLDKGWLSFVHPEDRDHCVRTYTPAVEKRQPFLIEFRLRRADGEYRWVLDAGVPKFDPDGRFSGYIGSCVDITERKHAEADLQQQRQELAHLTRVATLGELGASFAHELNQPLTAILTNAEAALKLLSSGQPAHEMAEALKDIIQDNHRAAEIVRRLRTLVRKERLEFALVDLETTLHEVTLLLHSDAVLHNVRMSLDIDDRLPPVRGDKVQLQQVVLNLLVNAFDAMHEMPANEREVVVQAEPGEAHTVTVAVRDCGSGLATDTRERIFHSFYTTKRDGLGMGLSISRSIVQAHGGRLWAENNPGRGATFFFTVPIDTSQLSMAADRAPR